MVTKSKEKIQVWKEYKVGLQINGEFGGQIPRSKTEIINMIQANAPKTKPEGAIQSLDELSQEVISQIDIQDEESDDYIPGWSTFKRNAKNEIMYEGRCVRGHLKDCALQVADFFPAIKQFRAKVVNALYVKESMFNVYDSSRNPIVEVDGVEQRFIHVMTARGERNAIKFLDYVVDPYIEFTLMLKNVNARPLHTITLEHIETMLSYGSTHGLGAERSQGWGRYSVTGITEIN